MHANLIKNCKLLHFEPPRSFLHHKLLIRLWLPKGQNKTVHVSPMLDNNMYTLDIQTFFICSFSVKQNVSIKGSALDHFSESWHGTLKAERLEQHLLFILMISPLTVCLTNIKLAQPYQSSVLRSSALASLVAVKTDAMHLSQPHLLCLGGCMCACRRSWGQFVIVVGYWWLPRQLSYGQLISRKCASLRDCQLHQDNLILILLFL